MSSVRVASRITPFLWFDQEADEAVDFYVSLFPNSRRLDGPRQPSSSPRRFVTVPFELDGQRFLALNGGPAFRFTEAVSFVVACQDQAELDAYWEGLLAGGGTPGRCGWLKDRFGLSWQVLPENIGQLLSRPGGLNAMMGMSRIEIATLERAGSPEESA